MEIEASRPCTTTFSPPLAQQHTEQRRFDVDLMNGERRERGLNISRRPSTSPSSKPSITLFSYYYHHLFPLLLSSDFLPNHTHDGRKGAALSLSLSSPFPSTAQPPCRQRHSSLPHWNCGFAARGLSPLMHPSRRDIDKAAQPGTVGFSPPARRPAGGLT